ncbi:TIR domain-containing protein [Nocardioides limicola]|uniref:TIR domain-containing protein n=1 Tax=Nocardioides limicola TaxID=2803368 RepID=UPI00193B4BD0|nr:nucleotide-binding protein [Nocardioides sp. DJM-14]
MRVAKNFARTHFSVPVLRAALAELRSLDHSDGSKRERLSLRFERDSETWATDDLDEWFAEVSTLPPDAFTSMEVARGQFSLEVNRYWESGSEVKIEAPTRVEVQRVLNVFNDAAEAGRLPEPAITEQQEPEAPRPVIFLGHGHSQDWRKIKDHLQDRHGYQVEGYELGSRAGHTIRDVLETMLAGTSFALLVMTGEDDGDGVTKRARQNVVHEAGLFQGRLGFHRAIAVVEEGVEVFSNLAGVDQIRYPRGNVENTFGDILATLRREFGDRR